MKIYKNHKSGYAKVEYVPKFYKYQYQDFVQPKLTDYGVLGGDNFACAVSGVYSNFYGWKAFDEDENTSWQSNETSTANTFLTFYNPKPLKITEIKARGT